MLFLYKIITYLAGTKLPAPCSTNADPINNINDGGKSQNEMLFNLGNAINFIIIQLFMMNFKYLHTCLDYVIEPLWFVGFSWLDYC